MVSGTRHTPAQRLRRRHSKNRHLNAWAARLRRAVVAAMLPVDGVIAVASAMNVTPGSSFAARKTVQISWRAARTRVSPSRSAASAVRNARTSSGDGRDMLGALGRERSGQ